MFKLEENKFKNEKQEITAELKKKDKTILELTSIKDKLSDELKQMKHEVHQASQNLDTLQTDNQNHVQRISLLETCLQDKDVKIKELKNLHDIEREQLLMNMQKLHLEIDYLSNKVQDAQDNQRNLEKLELS